MAGNVIKSDSIERGWVGILTCHKLSINLAHTYPSNSANLNVLNVCYPVPPLNMTENIQLEYEN